MNADTLADEVRTLEAEFQKGLRNSIDLAADIGERLERAKAELPHGQFEPWLRKAGVAKTTAHTYRAVARYRNEGKFPTGATTLRQFVASMKRANKEATKRVDVAEDMDAPVEEHGVHLADAATFDFGNVDIVATDPPWAEMDAYRTTGRILAASLVKDGVALIQCGNATIHKAIEAVLEGANGQVLFFWPLAILYPVATMNRKRGLASAWRPVLLFGRHRPRKKMIVEDVAKAPTTAKELHEWQQPPEPWRYWLNAFAQRPRIRVADPYSGSGTIGAVCQELGFEFVGTEKNPTHYRTANKRLAIRS